ncbi:hypothetical protein ACHAWO_008311 [Cyclotella atomus]|uniref:Uncharacterized protein n=1 Tax=Cyclotella atomus TaxID=382360 RepID=A0ABD3NM27_9STRA
MLPAPPAIPHAPVPPVVPHVPVPPPIPLVPVGDASATPPPTHPALTPPTPGPEFDAETDDEEESRRYPSRSNVGNWKDGPRKDDVLKEHKGKWKTGLMCLLTLPAFALSAVRDWGQPPPGVTNIGAKEGLAFLVLKVSKQHLNNLAVLQDDWSNLAACTAMGTIVLTLRLI